jgi:hypothetical protein
MAMEVNARARSCGFDLEKSEFKELMVVVLVIMSLFVSLEFLGAGGHNVISG